MPFFLCATVKALSPFVFVAQDLFFPFSRQGSLLVQRHGCHSQVLPVDTAVAGGLCASYDGTVLVTLHHSGNIIAWSECRSAALYDDTSRFRAICSNEGRAANILTFISPKVVALGCADTSIVLWHVVDEKRGLSWKGHSSGVSMFLVTEGPPDGLASHSLFSFSRNGVGQARLVLQQHIYAFLT